jgi:hypothetical protein
VVNLILFRIVSETEKNAVVNVFLCRIVMKRRKRRGKPYSLSDCFGNGEKGCG